MTGKRKHIENPEGMEMLYPLDNLIPEIVSDDNIFSSFDYVIGHLEHQEQRKHYAPLRDRFVTLLQQEIGNGSFRISPH